MMRIYSYKLIPGKQLYQSAENIGSWYSLLLSIEQYLRHYHKRIGKTLLFYQSLYLDK